MVLGLLSKEAQTLLILTLLGLFTVIAGAPAPVSSDKHAKDFVFIRLRDHGPYQVNVSRRENVKLGCGGVEEIADVSGTTWLKNGSQLSPDDHPRTTLEQRVLTIYRIEVRDGGVYGCEVKDPNSLAPRILRSIDLRVLPAHKAERQEAGSGDAGNSVSTAYTKPSDPSSVDSDEDYYEEYDDEEELTQQRQDQIDSCRNIEPGNKSYICLDLDLNKMTHYVVRPAGTRAQIYCNARGNPPPNINWLKDDVPFVKSGYQQKIGKNSLTLSDVTLHDSGTYTCEVKSTDQTLQPILYETKLEITERTNAKPIFTEAPSNQTVLVGGSVELRVGILSHPEYSLQWLKHDPTNLKEFVVAQSRTNDPELKKDYNVLVLENMTLSDEGWYSCLVGNSVGLAMTSAYISVVEEVPNVQARPQQIDQPKLAGTFAYVVIGAVIVVVAFAGFSFIFQQCHLVRSREREAKKAPIRWTKQIIIERRPADDNDEGSILIPEVNIKSIETTKGGQEYELPMDMSWEFPREKLALGNKIGEGAFGEVWIARAEDITEKEIVSTVAVKSLKKTHTDAEMIDLISEMETMKELGKHVNIINLLGCCTQAGELLVIMEFAEQGNLRDYLRGNRHQFMYETPRLAPIPNKEDELNFRDLMSFAFQVARGMDYLVQRKYVHRDLAARNVLVSSGKVVKIADFGMTRSTFTSDYYRKKSDGRVPVKWMAPETLFHRIYTTQSDVWSYGILLWEIVTLGGTPYPSMPDVSKLLDFLKSGRRMGQPSNCPDELYMIMRDCWFEVPGARPSFSQLAEDIERILHIAAGTEYMDMEGVRPLEDVPTPESSPENSAGMIAFDPDFLKAVLENGLEGPPYY